MARILGKQNNNASMMKSGLESMNLSFCLGYSNSEDYLVENSPASNNDSAINSTYAQRILPEDIKTVFKIPTNSSKYWTSGISPGQYFSSGEKSGQFLFISNNTLFMIVGQDGILNRTDLIGSMITKGALSDTTGAMSSVDGFQYFAIKSLNGIDELSSKYIEVPIYEDEWKKFNGTTSVTTKATNICGAGNKGKTGNCCLYRSESGYDDVAGVTYDAGDFYKCICSKCYRCLEIAELLDMQYQFHKFTNGATGPECLCDSETFPTDCGPCNCTIDWDKDSIYSSITSGSNIATTSAISKSASIAQYHKTNYSGSILSANIDLSKLTWQQKKLSSAYSSKVIDGTLRLPLVGSCKTEAHISIACVFDSITKEYAIDGFFSVSQHGSEYTSVSVDATKFALYFPDFPSDEIINRININVSPIGGIPENISNVLDLSCLIKVVVNSDNVLSTIPSTIFNHYSIARLSDKFGGSMYSGCGTRQRVSTSLVPEFVCTASGFSAPTAIDIPLKQEIMKNEPGDASSIFTDTSIKEIVPYDGILKDGLLTLPLQTAFAENRIGQVFIRVEDNKSWMIDSISYRPTTYGGINYDPMKSNFIIRKPISLNLNQNPKNIKTSSFEILWGSEFPKIGEY